MIEPMDQSHFSPQGEVAQLDVTYRNADEVQAFLQESTAIEQLIVAAAPALVRCFGPSIRVVLEVVPSPEDGDSDMVAWIQWQGTVEEGLRHFEQFEDEWLLDHLDEMEQSIIFSIEVR